MKKKYIKPGMYIDLCDVCDVMATSVIEINLRDDEFDGEGRVRLWEDLFDVEEIKVDEEF